MQELNSPIIFIDRFPWQPQFAWDIIAAAKEVDLGVSEDLVGANITGFTVAQTISKSGVRASSARSFLWPVRNRKNLHVALNATATKIDAKRVNSKAKAEGITVIMVSRSTVFFKFTRVLRLYLYERVFMRTGGILFAERTTV